MIQTTRYTSTQSKTLDCRIGRFHWSDLGGTTDQILGFRIFQKVRICQLRFLNSYELTRPQEQSKKTNTRNKEGYDLICLQGHLDAFKINRFIQNVFWAIENINA